MERCRREHFALLRAALAAHRGREVKNVGDGLMAAFARAADGCRVRDRDADGRGRPADPRRTTAAHARRLHSGPTIEAEGDHWGTTVVVARRLCDLAQPQRDPRDATLAAAAGAEPRARPRPRADVAEGPRRRRSRVCAMRWDGAPPARARRWPSRCTSSCPRGCARTGGFVGREARARATCGRGGRRPRRGSGGCSSSPARPGIGKTSLVAELGREVHASGAIVLYGRCDEGIAVPFQPVAEALRQLVAALPPRACACSSEAGRRTSRACCRRSPGGSAAARRARARIPKPTSTSCSRRSRSSSRPPRAARRSCWSSRICTGPTARRSRCCASLAAAQPAAPLAVVATVRDGELAAGHPLHPSAAEPVPRLSLAGLDESDVAAMLEADGGRPAGVGARTGGARARRLATRCTPPSWHEHGARRDRSSCAIARSRSPAERRRGARTRTCASVIGRRVGRLPGEARRVLTLGSVFGRRFSLAVLEQILAADEPADLRSALGLAVDERVVVRGRRRRRATRSRTR